MRNSPSGLGRLLRDRAGTATLPKQEGRSHDAWTALRASERVTRRAVLITFCKQTCSAKPESLRSSGANSLGPSVARLGDGRRLDAPIMRPKLQPCVSHFVLHGIFRKEREGKFR